MPAKYLKKIPILASLIVLVVFPGIAAAQYNVSGVVEFSYSGYETKTGDAISRGSYVIQTYRANTRGFAWDPRFMVFGAGVGYQVRDDRNNIKTSTLDYNLNTTFFPGMKVSWDLFGNRSTSSFTSSANIAGYDVTTTTYGAGLNLRLSRNGNGRNNNNNNNNFYRSRQTIPLPDISLRYARTTAESLSAGHPLDEVRDDTRATIRYRLPSFTMELDGGLEQYENLITNTAYETKTANLASTIDVIPNADLKIGGSLVDRTSENSLTISTDSEKRQSFYTTLDFKERDRLKHYYRYNFRSQETVRQDYATHAGNAGVSYKLTSEVNMFGNVNYSQSELVTKATPSTAEFSTDLDSVAAGAGAQYRRVYNPDAFKAFSFDTGYSFQSGYNSYSSQTGGPEGSGLFYGNTIGLGMSSRGWAKESLSFNYDFTNRRDYSPVNNDTARHSYRGSFLTRRIVRTTINISASYTSQESHVARMGDRFIVSTEQTIQQQRSLIYSIAADHALNRYVGLNAGASRGQTTQNASYTLATASPTSSTETEEILLYGGATLSYAITRNLNYKAAFREEYRDSNITRDTRSRHFDTGITWRIRQVFLNVDYRLREDMPADQLRTVQQLYFARISRPF